LQPGDLEEMLAIVLVQGESRAIRGGAGCEGAGDLHEGVPGILRREFRRSNPFAAAGGGKAGARAVRAGGGR